MRDDLAVQSDPKQILDKRFEALAWALFLIMIGCLWLMPEGVLPDYTWLFGAGAIMLGLNATRLVNGIRTCGFTIILGVLAVYAGCSRAWDFEMRLVPILLIIAGISIVYTIVLRRRRV